MSEANLPEGLRNGLAHGLSADMDASTCLLMWRQGRHCARQMHLSGLWLGKCARCPPIRSAILYIFFYCRYPIGKLPDIRWDLPHRFESCRLRVTCAVVPERLRGLTRNCQYILCGVLSHFERLGFRGVQLGAQHMCDHGHRSARKLRSKPATCYP